MDSNDAYDKFRATVKREAEKMRRPLEVTQAALWAKAIAVEAFAGKCDGIRLVGKDDTFGFSEQLVNQCIEYAMREYGRGRADDSALKEAWQRGYESARLEFAKATGLYCEHCDD